VQTNTCPGQAKFESYLSQGQAGIHLSFQALPKGDGLNLGISDLLSTIRGVVSLFCWKGGVETRGGAMFLSMAQMIMKADFHSNSQR